MEKKKVTNNNEIPKPNLKKEWEEPKLYALDKGKTEGGIRADSVYEDETYDKVS